METTIRVAGLTIDTQQKRRVLVAALYASYALMLVPFWLAHAVAKPLLALAIPAFLAFAACFWTLSQVTRAYAFGSDGRASVLTDERQAQVRDRSFAKAYWILSSLVTAGLLYAMLAGDFSWWMPKPSQMQGVFFLVILLTATLPSAVVAWVEPDEED